MRSKIKKVKTITFDFKDLPYYVIIEIISYYKHEFKKEYKPIKLFGKFNLDRFKKRFLIFKCISIENIQHPINKHNLPFKIRSLIVEKCEQFIGDNLPKSISNLKVDNCDKFIGDNLPKSITSLDVGRCHQFIGDNLPKLITSLNVWMCDNFKGNNLPVSITSLEVHYCYNFKGNNLVNKIFRDMLLL